MLPFRMFASRFAFRLSVTRSLRQPSLLCPPAKDDCLPTPLYFHTLTHSFALRKMLSPIFSSISALFAKNAGAAHPSHGYTSVLGLPSVHLITLVLSLAYTLFPVATGVGGTQHFVSNSAQKLDAARALTNRQRSSVAAAPLSAVPCSLPSFPVECLVHVHL